MIIASCGHEISLEWHSDNKSSIEYMQYDNGKPVIVGSVVCPKCRKMYELKNLVVKNERQRNGWLYKNSN